MSRVLRLPNLEADLPISVVICDTVEGFTAGGQVFVNIGPALKDLSRSTCWSPDVVILMQKSFYQTVTHELAHRGFAGHDEKFATQLQRITFKCSSCSLALFSELNES